eukprot:TRINITY_DN11481_c0_g1_i1.p1 TRINITY_DN11481_c0_g1~~TRINITY_DN11481_c0_g1_i1.p1  ORF type:complete len:379 (-),score=73.42 TRINITY_DN11481_c0_g1_i1:30-1166(-)
MSTQSYKVQYNEQIRRFSLPYDSTYPQLRKKLEELFIDIPKDFQICYTDEENDKISINSQFEYEEAKRLNNMIVRLIIEHRGAKKTSQQNSTQDNNKTNNNNASNDASSRSTNPAASLAQSSLVQTLLFIQPYITNPQMLKMILPMFMNELNKNNIVPKEDIGKICQHANQILDYPFVQEFLTKQLPKVLHQVVGSQPPAPVATVHTVNEPARSNEKAPTEQIYDYLNSFMTYAQNVASNVTLPSMPSASASSSSTSTPAEPPKRTAPRPSTEPQAPSSNSDNCFYQPSNSLSYAPSPVNVNPILPVPVTVPVPVEKKEEKVETRPKFEPTATKFPKELQQLKEIGFDESNYLIELLNAAHGDIMLVIDQLTAETMDQ